MTDTQSPERQYNILVFGLEQKSLPVPSEPIRTRNFSVFFENFKTHRRFQEYDGAIIFQGAFEKFERKSNYMDTYLAHSCEVDELDKRKKEAALLLGKGGFLCFLLTDFFIESDGGRDFKSTDLAKYHLNYSHFYRENFQKRNSNVIPVLDEFKRFLEVFGAASSHFHNLNDTLDCRTLARVGNSPVGLLLNQAEYYLPSLVPNGRTEVIEEYFQLLVDALTSVHNKLHQVIPEWVAAYRFPEESLLDDERTKLMSNVVTIDERLGQLNQYKAALVHSGPELVADVCAILEATLGIKVDAVDEFREDIKLIGDDNKIIAVGEIKGINRGISRENINQTDSHRERSGFSQDFPALLIANTNIKSARSISEKEQEIAAEQVRHAVHMHILIMRTIDLLGLLRIVLSGKLTKQMACLKVLSSVGWLRVQADQVELLSGE